MNVTDGIYYECGNCKQQYSDLAVAEDCCKPRACECGRTIEKRHYSLCNVCIEHNAQFSWECAERADSTPALYSEAEDFYFWSIEDLIDRVMNNIEDPEIVPISYETPLPEVARRCRVYLTEPVIPRHFNLAEYFLDRLDAEDDYRLPDGWEQAEKAVNDWVRSVPLDKWPVWPSKIAWSGQ